MERKAITCPLTGHLETVDLDRTHLGIVVEGCTRFSPAEDVRCTCECARLLDARDHLDEDDREDRVLVLYAGGTRGRVPADVIATSLRGDACKVEIADVETRGTPPPEDYDAVVIVATLRAWGYPIATTQFLRDHADVLREMPTWFVSVSPKGEASANRLWRDAGWCPPGVAAIATPHRWPRSTIPQPLEHRAAEIARMIADDL